MDHNIETLVHTYNIGRNGRSATCVQTAKNSNHALHWRLVRCNLSLEVVWLNGQRNGFQVMRLLANYCKSMMFPNQENNIKAKTM